MPFFIYLIFIYFFHVDNSPQRKNEGKLSRTQIIWISVSVAVASLTVVVVACYWGRYEDIFALYWLSRVAFLLLTDESLLRDRLGKSKKGSLDQKRDLVACVNGLLQATMF